MSRLNLAGRTVVITGATGGLGNGLAAALRARGANLALLDLDGDCAQAQAEGLGPDTVARGWAVDVRSLDSLTSTMDEVAQHFGRVDVIIAGAGIASIAPLETMDPAVFERTIDINLNGAWRTFRAALPHVKKTKGHLLAISSLAALVHAPLNGHYAASKAGTWALCDATRLEVRHYGVTVSSVHPTFFKTPMMDAIQADAAGHTIWRGNTSRMWRLIELDEVVDSVVVGIERRTPMIVAPRSNALAARIPGLVRPLVDRFGFPGSTIPDAIKQVSTAS